MRIVRETLAIAALGLQIGAVWFFWDRLPAEIPTHFGFSGAADGYGAKSTLATLPAVALMLYALMTAVSFFPRMMNFPVTVTEENRDRLQGIGVAMLGWVKAETAWIFAYISWATIRVGLGVERGLGWAFLPATVGVLGATICVGIVQMRRAA